MTSCPMHAAFISPLQAYRHTYIEILTYTIDVQYSSIIYITWNPTLHIVSYFTENINWGFERSTIVTWQNTIQTTHKDVFQAMLVYSLLLFNNHGLRGLRWVSVCRWGNPSLFCPETGWLFGMSKRWWCGINTDNAHEHRGLIYVFTYRLLNNLWWIQNTITSAYSFNTTEMSLSSSFPLRWSHRIL